MKQKILSEKKKLARLVAVEKAAVWILALTFLYLWVNLAAELL